MRNPEIFLTRDGSRAFVSFGYNYGDPPMGLDVTFDARWIKNPWKGQKPPKSVRDEMYRARVLENPRVQMWLDDLVTHLQANPQWKIIGIGCSFGAHRSVAIARELAGRM